MLNLRKLPFVKPVDEKQNQANWFALHKAMSSRVPCVKATLNGKTIQHATVTPLDTFLTSGPSIVEFGAWERKSDGLIIPQDGIWIWGLSTNWTSNSNGVRFATPTLNGSVYSLDRDRRPAGDNSEQVISLMDERFKGDKLGISVYQTSGGPLGLTFARFWAVWQSP